MEEIGRDPGELREPSDDVASVVTVEKSEDLAAVCGRVDAAPTWAVVIHAPDGNRQLSAELGMRRLIHHAEEAGKVIAIATRNAALASRARELGVPVAGKPHHVRWDAGGRHVIRVGPLNIAAPGIGRYVQAAIILGVAFAGVFLLLAMAPSAKVTAYPPTETVSEVVVVTAAENRTIIDLETMAVPASRVSAEQTYTLALKTTGTTQVGIQPARARVAITNGSAAAVFLPAGTVLLAAPDFAPFTLDAEVTAPAGGTAEAAVTAQKPGAAGNVPAGAIVGWQAEKYRFLKVTNAAPAAGGVSEPRPAVDPADVLALQSMAKALEGSPVVKQGLLQARPHDAVFLGTAEGKADYGDARPTVGTPSDIVLLDVTVKLSALAVVETTLEELAGRVLAPYAPAGAFIPGSVKAIETGARQIDAATGEIRTELRIQGELARGVTEEAIRDAVKGKSTGAARSTLAERYGIQDADVRLSAWAPRLPRFDFRIDVELAARETPVSLETTRTNGPTATPTAATTPRP